jgi:hypothetical protein
MAFRSAIPSAFGSALVLGAVILSATEAHAFPGVTGYSGKPYDGMATTCEMTCHTNNSAPPKLTITVPSSVTANSKVDVKIVVAGSKARTSLNAALSDGVVATKGMNTDIPFPMETPGEVAAVIPPPSGATGTYTFSFVAPKANGPIMLWVAGMSASGSGTGGDGVAKDTRTIMVTGGTAPDPDAGAPGPGQPSPSDAGTSSSGGTGSSSGGTDDDDGADPEEGDPSSSSGRSRRSSTEEAGGCSVTAAAASSGGVVPAGVAFLWIARVLRRRRATPSC